MNIYVVVEGAVGEKRIYRSWIPLVNDKLSYAATIDDVSINSFYIVSGFGFPQYELMIERAIQDVLVMTADDGHSKFNRLVVAVDSEEYSYEEKRNYLIALIKKELGKQKVKHFDYKLIVQHFCLETWGLGNRKIIERQNKSDELKEYTKHFDVSKKDPELLTSFDEDAFTRAQHAERYLRIALLNKHRCLTYKKGSPDVLCHDKYFFELKKRINETKHISSFQDFLDAFK